MEELLTIARETRPDLVLTEVFFGGVSAIDAAIRVRDLRGCTVVLMSGRPDTTELLRQVRESGHEAFTIVAKPTPPSELLRAVRQILDMKKAQPKTVLIAERVRVLGKRSARLLSRGKELREQSVRLTSRHFSSAPA